MKKLFISMLALVCLTISGWAQAPKTLSGLPSGLTLSASGLISGTPATGSQGVYSFNVIACDSETPPLCSPSTPFTLTVYGPVVISTTSPLPTAVVGTPYSLQLQGNGGNGNLTYTIQ